MGVSAMFRGIIHPTNRSAPAVLATPRSADDHHGRMTAMRSIRVPLHSRKYPDLFALVDEEDADRVLAKRWHPVLIRGSFYVATGRESHSYLHRFVMGADPGFDVDHIDGNTLNNCRSNLRICTHQQNQQNIIRSTPSRSGYRGVVQTRSGRWAARLKTDGICHYFGTFDTPEEAAIARDNAARKHFGEYARLNFPNSGEQAA